LEKILKIYILIFMPTYTVTNSNFNLTSKQQKNLAEGITKVHNIVTGANTYFAQVIFNKTKKNNHFMGGKKVKEPSIFLLGQIRAGRTKNVKDKLISELKNILVKKSKLDETQVWVYINDLPPSQMIEYGAVLPESGKESEWFKNLSSKLKKKLSNIEKN
tara:strand:+ start:648 stop:1127 length:480 start_codon:yes stop_codon:yes gene_type:complete